MKRHATKQPAMRTLRLLPVLVGLAAVASAQTASAQHRDDPRFRGDIARFHEHDWQVWRGGRWLHAQHGGRWGWWWVVGGVWYFYPAPVYPYPDPYVPPPASIVTPSASNPPPPPVPQNWYYCDGAKAYYPYVATCPGGWRSVPATPNQPPPGAPPAP